MPLPSLSEVLEPITDPKAKMFVAQAACDAMRAYLIHKDQLKDFRNWLNTTDYWKK